MCADRPPPRESLRDPASCPGSPVGGSRAGAGRGLLTQHLCQAGRGGGCGHTPAPSAAGTVGAGGGLSEGTPPEARESLADAAGEGVGSRSKPGGGRGRDQLSGCKLGITLSRPAPSPDSPGRSSLPAPAARWPLGLHPLPPTSPANVPLGAPILCFLANEFTRRPYLGGGKLPSRPGFNSSPGPLFNQGPAVTALSGVWGRSGEQGPPPAPPAPGAITQSLPIGFLASTLTLYPSSPHSIPAPPQRTFKNTSLYFSAQNHRQASGHV